MSITITPATWNRLPVPVRDFLDRRLKEMWISPRDCYALTMRDRWWIIHRYRTHDGIPYTNWVWNLHRWLRRNGLARQRWASWPGEGPARRLPLPLRVR